MKPLPQAPPEVGEEPRREHFSYTGTEPNSKWTGWVAGPAMWFMCHQPKKTKPCLAIMTNRKVECPWCGTGKDVVQRGYVPLYRQTDGAPRCVIVNDLYKDVCARLKLHDRVMIGKEGEKADPVWIMKAFESRPLFQTTLKHREQPVDLTCSLLRIWGNDALVKWYAEYTRDDGKQPSDNAVSLPAPGKPVEGWSQFVDVGSIGTMKGNVANPGQHRNEAFVQQTKSNGKPSKNGKHPPPDAE